MNAIPTDVPARPPLDVERDPRGVVTLVLNRPDAFNALSEALLDALRDALEAASADPGVRAIVIAARGRAFCAGHDLKEMRAEPSEGYYRQLFARCTAMMMAIRRAPVPVIARVEGIATAAGCQLVAMCDLAVAADDARFAVSGVRLGLFCSTPSVPLSRNVPAKVAFEMLVTGDFVDADTALRHALINRVAPAGRGRRRGGGPGRIDPREARRRRPPGQGAVLRAARGAGRGRLRARRRGHGLQHDGRVRARGRAGVHREAAGAPPSRPRRSRMSRRHDGGPARDDFDATLRRIWNVVPNGPLYASLRDGDSIARIRADPGAFLGTEHLQGLLALTGRATVAALPDVPETADIRLPIELAMLLVATAGDAPGRTFARLLERQVTDSLDRCANAPVARELSVLLHRFHRTDGERQEHHLSKEVAITTRDMTHWPNLVGASVVRYGRWLLDGGDRARADDMFARVILDLRYLVRRIDDEALPAAERMTALWWLAEAHAGRAAAGATDADHEGEARSIRELLAARGIDEVPSGVRVGVLVSPYRTEDERLAAVVERLVESGTARERLRVELVHEHGVSSRQVDACLSAMASFPVRRMLVDAGAKALYGEEEEKVFRLLDARARDRDA